MARRAPRKVTKGTCAGCGTSLTLESMKAHLLGPCPAWKEGPDSLLLLSVTSPWYPWYWLLVQAEARTDLDALDGFLRRTWLECCGHMSAFRKGKVRYERSLEVRGRVREEPAGKTMRASLAEALGGRGPLEHVYDFGSTTVCAIDSAGHRNGRASRGGLVLLARNDPPDYRCDSCGAPATDVCTVGCDRPYSCSGCSVKHACGSGGETMLPLVNSPRAGVCGYSG